jgi:neutral amino acid transport system ATP-binding protein
LADDIGIDNDNDNDIPSVMLSVRTVSKSFGGITAVDRCDLSVERGTIVGLIGPNGAGKSTLFEIISGFQRPDSGRIEFLGRDITGMQPNRVAMLGMIRTFQIPRALCRMTVLENMMLGAEDQMGETVWDALVRRRCVAAEEGAVEERAVALLESFNLIHMKNQYAGSLSGGQKKLLEMARALMAKPKMLLLDEPFAGVNPALSERLIEMIKGLRDQGMTMLVIEHGIPYVMALSDHVYVLNKGAVMAQGKPEEIVSDKRVLEAYLGEGEAC